MCGGIEFLKLVDKYIVSDKTVPIGGLRPLSLRPASGCNVTDFVLEKIPEAVSGGSVSLAQVRGGRAVHGHVNLSMSTLVGAWGPCCTCRATRRALASALSAGYHTLPNLKALT